MDRSVILLLGDVVCGKHVAEHFVPALQARLGILFRIVGGGRLGNAGERSRLDERKILGAHLVVILRRRLDAIAPIAIVDGVEVHVEDLVFSVFLLHLDGELRLARFALERDAGGLFGQGRVAHELLRDGGSAFARPARQIVQERAHDALGVDPVVLVEANVLDVNGALDGIFAHVFQFDGIALFQLELGKLRRAVSRIHVGVLGIIERVAVQFRQIGDPVVVDGENTRDAPEAHEADAENDHEDDPSHRMGFRLAEFTSCFHECRFRCCRL